MYRSVTFKNLLEVVFLIKNWKHFENAMKKPM